MKITFLGTGTSHGVPSLDCMLDNYERCPKGVCRASENDPKHKRGRSSIFIEMEKKYILIDVTPDFREQALRENLPRIDAVLLTHKHSDHVSGIPDIRSYTRLLDRPLDVYGSEETIECIKNQFSYIFDPDTFIGGGIPRLSVHDVSAGFKLFNKKIIPIPVIHGPLKGCYGYRIGKMAYIPDMKEIAEKEIDKLKGLNCLILNCLRETREHSTHMILEQSIALARKIRPDKCYFIHMCHDIHYKKDSENLDEWMSFAYDGLSISV